MTDDEFCTNEMLWGFASRRASKYSEDLSAHVRRGYEATAPRGSGSLLFRGIKVGGYEAIRSFDERG